MARKKIKKICLNCSKEFEVADKGTKFCGHSCSAKFNNKNLNPATKAKIKEKITEYWKLHPEKRSKGLRHAKLVGKTTRGKYREKPPESILELSKRTVQKILTRLGIGCCICGWNESSCDIHHIEGKKIKDPNNHSNLTYICPNHHRMIHNKKLDKNKLITFDIYVKDKWKEFYFG